MSIQRIIRFHDFWKMVDFLIGLLNKSVFCTIVNDVRPKFQLSEA